MDFDNLTKEKLIGKEFKNSISDIYKIIEANSKRKDMVDLLKRGEKSPITDYHIKDILKYLRLGDFILLYSSINEKNI